VVPALAALTTRMLAPTAVAATRSTSSVAVTGTAADISAAAMQEQGCPGRSGVELARQDLLCPVRVCRQEPLAIPATATKTLTTLMTMRMTQTTTTSPDNPHR
jgi:hypothetical protein